MKLFKERQKTTEETLQELKKLIEEINAAEKEQIEKCMSPEIFTVYWLFKQRGLSEPEKLANQIGVVFSQYPHWKGSNAQEKEVRRELYALVMTAGIEDIALANEIIEDIVKKLKVVGQP